jgi:hypothetical protein
LDHRLTAKDEFHHPIRLLNEVEIKAMNLITGTAKLNRVQSAPLLAREIRQQMDVILSLSQLNKRYPLPIASSYKTSIKEITQNLKDSPERWTTLFSWSFLHNLGKLANPEDYKNQTLSWLDEWQIGKSLENLFVEMGFSTEKSWSMMNLVRLLIIQQDWSDQIQQTTLRELVESWLKIPEIQVKLGVNRYNDMLWFNKEGFEEFLWWMYLLAILHIAASTNLDANIMIESILKIYHVIEKIKTAEEKSGFQVQKLLSLLEKKTRKRVNLN